MDALNPLLDALGADVSGVLAAAAAKWAIPLLLLVTCARAESGMDPRAYRANGLADSSVGPFQQTLLYAPIGDHSISPANVALCRERFGDWAFAADVAGANLAGKWATAIAGGLSGDEAIMEALSGYNSGSDQPIGDWWWSGSGEANYAAALTWAKGELGG